MTSSSPMGRRSGWASASSARAIRAIVALAAVATCACATSTKNVALVVGNASYERTAPLANPANDARLVASTLKDLGWSVETLVDRPRAAFDTALDAFSDRVARADQALLFYAGHGVQIDGKNYLVPTEFEPEGFDRDRDLIALDAILARIETGQTQLAVILDACRDNPLAAAIEGGAGTGRGLAVSRRDDPSKEVGIAAEAGRVGRGLAEVTAGAGMFIAYATEPGNVARDGSGTNSPFSGAFARHMRVRNVGIGSVLQRVRTDVVTETRGVQVPWDHSSLVRKFVLYSKKVSAPPP